MRGNRTIVGLVVVLLAVSGCSARAATIDRAEPSEAESSDGETEFRSGLDAAALDACESLDVFFEVVDRKYPEPDMPGEDGYDNPDWALSIAERAQESDVDKIATVGEELETGVRGNDQWNFILDELWDLCRFVS